MSHTHLIQRDSERVFIRTEILDNMPDMDPAVWDQAQGKAVRYYKGQEEAPAVPRVDAETSAIRTELEELTKAELDHLAQAKFGQGIPTGNKASMVDAFLKLAAEAKEA